MVTCSNPLLRSPAEWAMFSKIAIRLSLSPDRGGRLPREVHIAARLHCREERPRLPLGTLTPGLWGVPPPPWSHCLHLALVMTPSSDESKARLPPKVIP